MHSILETPGFPVDPVQESHKEITPAWQCVRRRLRRPSLRTNASNPEPMRLRPEWIGRLAAATTRKALFEVLGS